MKVLVAKLTITYMIEKMAIVQYLPRYESARNAPNKGVIKHVPPQFRLFLEAVALC